VFTISRSTYRAGAGVLATALCVSTFGSVGAATADAPSISFEQVWERTFSYDSVSTGSPGVAELDGQGLSVIVGTVDGKATALHLTDGSTVDGWPYSTGSSITSTPSVAGTGADTLIYFGVGTSSKPSVGGYLALTADGKKKWYRHPHLLPSSHSSYRGVMGSLAVGNLQTGSDVVGGAMGQMQLAMRGSDGKSLQGWPWLQADTNFSSPAVAEIYPDKDHDYVIEGGDSTKGVAYYKSYSRGGHIRILRPKGNYAKKYPNSGLVCEYKTNQVVQSSPAVGPFLGDGADGIVVGTGKYYSSASDTNRLIAIDTACHKKWSRLLDGRTLTSPALADLAGTGSLDVLEVSSAGTVYALNGEDGTDIWTHNIGEGAIGSVTTFEAPGGGFQYVLVPGVSRLTVLDGRDGSFVTTLGGMSLKSAATVTRDPDGSIGITIAGGSSGHAVVQHFRVVGSSVTTVQTPGAWPMFHHDPQLTGYAKEFEPTP
jgi:outer membrane protein assembly factor BamB